MNDDITIITAYFNCGRDKNEGQCRTDEDYIEYFRFWARMKNMVIVYTSSDFADRILEVRREFGVEERTKVIVINDLWSIEEDLMQAMLRIETQGEFANLRIRRDDMSNQARYSYLMLMKYWFMKDAVAKNLTEKQVAWFDFGYNHGGVAFFDPMDFAFEWKYPFSDKVQLWQIRGEDDEMGLVKLLTMTDSIMGGLIVSPRELCQELFDLCYEAMWGLVTLDCFDDDQMLLRMAYKRKPGLFEIHNSKWFLPIKECGGAHLKVKEIERVQKNSFKDNLINGISKIKHSVFPHSLNREVKLLRDNIAKALMEEVMKEYL